MRAILHLLDFLRDRKKGYHAIPQVVREDMAKFCCAFKDCVKLKPDGSVDVERTLILQGRREVWLRMEQHWNLTANELAVLYRATDPNAQENDDD